MKIQMQDTSEIVTQLDLAPPTKRLMHMKETGGLDKLFTLPGRAIPSRILQRMFTRNLRSQPLTEEEEQAGMMSTTTADDSRPHLIFRPSASTAGTTAIEEQLLSAAATPRVSVALLELLLGFVISLISAAEPSLVHASCRGRPRTHYFVVSGWASSLEVIFISHYSFSCSAYSCKTLERVVEPVI